MTTNHSNSDSSTDGGDHLTEEQHRTSVWQQFNLEFETEQSCMERIYEHAFGMSLLKCSYCASSHFDRTYGKRVAICSNCGKKKWLTSKTFFDHIKKGRHYLALFSFMEQGVSINPNQFHKLVGIAYSTAQAVFKKIAHVVESDMPDSHVHSALFAKIIARRSLETPARSSPIAEQEAAEMEHLGDALRYSSEQAGSLAATSDTAPKEDPCEARQGLDCDTALRSDDSYSNAERIAVPDVPFPHEPALTELSEREMSVYGLLSQTPVHFESICQNTAMKASEASTVLMCLELAGLVKRTIGDWYTSWSPTDSKTHIKPVLLSGCSSSTDETMKSVKDAISYIYTVSKGISRKYLQLYLAAHWCKRDRVRWRPGSLITACYLFGCVPYRSIRAYVTPLMVRISSPAQDGREKLIE